MDMNVWIAWVYYNIVIGVFTDRELAVKALDTQCTDKRHKEGHADPEKNYNGCYTTSTKLNEINEVNG